MQPEATHPQPQVAPELAQRAGVQEVDALDHGVVAGAADAVRGAAAAAPTGAGAALLLSLLSRRLGRVLHLLPVSPQRLQLFLILLE